MPLRKHFERIRSRRFYVRLYLAFASAAVFISLLSIWGFYYGAREDMIESERRVSRDLLTQIRYNLQTLDEMNRTLCFTILGSNEAQGLLYTTQEDNYNLMLLRNRLESSLRSNPFVHSVYLYNSSRDVYYSTFRSFHYVDDGFLQSIEAGLLRPNLKPLVREADGQIVLTYGLGELFGRTEKDVAIYVNVNLDFLLNNMDAFSQGHLLILDDRLQPIRRLGTSADVPDAVLDALTRALTNGADMNEAVLLSLDVPGEGRHIATVLRADGIDWTLARIQPYREVFPRTVRLRVMMLAIGGAVLLVIVVLYAWISRRMYQPIRGVLSQVTGTADLHGEDEFAYLARFYGDMREELSALQSAWENRPLLSDLSAQKLITESRLMNSDEIVALVKEYALPIELDQPMTLMLFSTDDYSQLPAAFSADADHSLVLFGLRNMLEELLGQEAPFVSTSTESATLAVLLNAADADAMRLVERANAFQSAALQTFNLTIAVAISAPIASPVAISDTYARTARRLRDRFILGKDAVMAGEGEVGRAVPDALERMQRLKAAVQTGNAQGAKTEAGQVFDQWRTQHTDDVLPQIIRLQQALHEGFVVLNGTRSDPIDCSELLRDVRDIQRYTLSAYRTQVMEALGRIGQAEPASPLRAETLADDIQAIITRDYGDAMLCAASIADRLGISPAYAGRVFNQRMSMSIPEYINQVRLEKAAAWLAASDLTVAEITRRVGYTSESYFFKLFKARYGTTPRSYGTCRT